MQYWVVRKSDRAFLVGGFFTGAPSFNPATEELVTIPDDVQVNPLIHRHDPTTNIRPLTTDEATAVEADRRARLFDDPEMARLVKSIGRATWEQLPAATRLTWPAFKDRFRVLYINAEQIP